MATIVKYNGVTIYNALTMTWDEEAVYDESGTDPIGHSFKLQFQGILHAQRVPLQASKTYISDESYGGTLFTALHRVRKQLLQPRKELTVTIDGIVVIHVTSSMGVGTQLDSSDTQNGPKPRTVSIEPLGGIAYRVQFSIDAVTIPCGRPRQASDFVISNRWSVSESMDANFFTTRTINGRMRMSRAPLNPGDNPAHWNKTLTIPTLENSFKRERITFNAVEDGLTATYEIVDRQVHQAAPWPATKIDAVHRETTNYFAYFISEISVRLEGNPACDKRILIERAIQIVDARLDITRITGGNAAFEHFEIVDHIGESAVIEVRVRLKRADTGTPRELITLRTKDLGTDLELPGLRRGTIPEHDIGYDSQLSPLPKPYGFMKGGERPDGERRPAVLFMLECYLQDPCHPQHQVGPFLGSSNAEGPPAETVPRRPPLEPKIYEDPNSDLFPPPTQPGDLNEDGFSADTKRAIYQMAKVSTEYRHASLSLQLPTTGDISYAGSRGNTQLSRIFSLGNTQIRRITRVDYERVGDEPVIPNPNDYVTPNNGQAIASNFNVETLPPIRTPDGSAAVHRTRATYVHLCSHDPASHRSPAGMSIATGKNPAMDIPGYQGNEWVPFGDTLG